MSGWGTGHGEATGHGEEHRVRDYSRSRLNAAAARIERKARSEEALSEAGLGEIAGNAAQIIN